MIPTLLSLLSPQTPAQILASMIAGLQAANFPVTNWITGGVARTILAVTATALSDLWSLVALIAASGFASLSSGDWLTLVAQYVYGLTRNPATSTIGLVTLQDGGGGPFTITVGQLTIVSGDGLEYTNTTGGVLPLNGTLQITVQAVSPGAEYNVGSGALTILATPLPGVTVNNPLVIGPVSQVGVGTGTVTPSGTPIIDAVIVVQILSPGAVGTATFQYSTDGGATFSGSHTTSGAFVVPGSGLTLAFAGAPFEINDEYLFSTSWITIVGTDQETDPSLQARCLARWPSLSVAPPQAVYELWAKAASPQVTQATAIPDPNVAGQVDVFVASGGGSAPAGVVAAAQLYINPRVPLTTTALVISATPVNFIVDGTMFVFNGFEDSALAEAASNLAAYVDSIGIAGGTAYFSAVEAAIQEPQGVRNVILTAPVPETDTVFALGQAPQLVADLDVQVLP